MASSFSVNRGEVRAYLKSSDMQRTLKQVGDDVAARARGNGAHNVTVTVTPNGGAKRDRAEVTVTNHDDNAAAVEFGNRRTNATRPLKRALGA